jgi:hypothetical protein
MSFGGYLDLDALDPLFLILAYLLGKVQMPQELQHLPVLAHPHRIETPNPFVFGFVDQLAGQGYPYPVFLPAILHDCRVLGFFVLAPFAVVAHDRDDLVRVVGSSATKATWSTLSTEAKYFAFRSESSFIEPKNRR